MRPSYTEVMLTVIAALLAAIAVKIYFPKSPLLGDSLIGPTGKDFERARAIADGAQRVEATKRLNSSVPVVRLNDSISLNGPVEVSGTVEVGNTVEVQIHDAAAEEQRYRRVLESFSNTQ